MKIDRQLYERLIAKFDFPLYLQMLLDDLDDNKKHTYLLNQIFFPKQCDIRQWVQNIEVIDFFHCQFKGKQFKQDFCNRTEIDSILWAQSKMKEIDKYTIFSKMEFNDYSEAKKNYPQAYYLLQPDYVSKLDEILFGQLSGYHRIKKNTWEKKLSDSISIELSNKREHHAIFSIVDYRLPEISLKIGNDYLRMWEMDIRQFIFLSESSFLFFYFDMNKILLDDANNIKSVTPYNDQPVIYHLEDEMKYVITNSWENIERYNKYLEIVFHLSAYYLGFFEKYLIKKFTL